MLKPFKVVVYHVSEGKLEPRAKKDVFMGYRDGVKGFKTQSPLARKVILSIGVIFDELSMLHSKSEEDSGKTSF